MASILQYARMAQAVYEFDPSVVGWSRIGSRPSRPSITEQFPGAAFSCGNEAVFAFKGTDTDVTGDLAADAGIGLGWNLEYYNHAQEFVQRTGTGSCNLITVCGHSLGGAIAQIVDNRLRMRFVTFNTPGVAIIPRSLDQMAVASLLGTGPMRILGAIGSTYRHPFQAAQDVGGLFYRVSGVNFRLGADVVGNSGVHYGQVIQIPYSGGALDVKKRHSIDTFVDELEDQNYGNVSLASVLD